MSRSRSRSPLRRSNGSLTGEYGRRDRGGGGDRTRSRIDQKSDRMVYLSNLPWELKWMELKDIIREKAGEVNFVEVLEERDGRSKGCAVVEFKHRDGANKCIENMHRTELRDRLIIAKEIRDPVAFFRKVKEDTGIDFLGGGDRLERNNRGNFDRGGAGGGGQVTINENETYGLSPNFLRQLGISTPLCNRVFLTNIPYNCSVGRLFDVCSLAGKVTWFDLQMDKDGKSKGMAVAEYSHPIEAVQAVSMLNNQRLFDRTLAVRLDRYPKDQERRDPNGLPFGLRAVGMGLGANGAPLTDVASVISSINPVTPSQQMMAMNGAASAPFAVVAAVPTPQMTGSWVTSGIPPAAAQPVIQPVHAPQGGYQQAAMAADHGGHYQQSPAHQPNSFQPHGGGGGGGGGFFNAPAQQSAGQQHRPTPGIPQFGGGGSGGGGGGSGAAMAAYAAPPKSAQASYVPTQAVAPQQYEAPVKYEMGGYGGYGSGSSAGNTGGAVQQSQGANAYDASRIILIKNLPQDYTWQIVSDRVQQFGDLESVEMITPGVAKVRFVQLKDAERAKQALQGTTVEGRAIGIEYL